MISKFAPKNVIAENICGINILTTNSGVNSSKIYKNRDDLAVIVFENGASVAGLFTKSTMKAAPVLYSKKILSNNDRIKAICVNAGNANAYTGEDGMKAVKKKAKALAKILHCGVSEILFASTGVIGAKLNVDGIVSSFSDMKTSDWRGFAKAIMTTDTFPKLLSFETAIDDKKIVINVIAKGSGMICPNMATMLVFIFTDANISAEVLKELLTKHNEISFNSISVDGDTSTNDSLFIFANGKAGNGIVTSANDLRIDQFSLDLKNAMQEIAKLVIKDGEGISKFIEVSVSGCKNNKSAKKIASSIANSPLIKTAIAGCDPNWGRVIMAIGKSGVSVKPGAISISFGDNRIIQNGELLSGYNEEIVHKYLKDNDEIRISVNCGDGEGFSCFWTSDFTEGYIRINKDYRS